MNQSVGVKSAGTGVTRANPAIWKLARFMQERYSHVAPHWEDVPEKVKDWYYDRALLLWRKTNMVSTVEL